MSETRKKIQLAGLTLGSYILWLSLFQWIGLALITYGMLDSSPEIQEIADQYSANFWTIQGLGSLGYFLLCWGLSVSRPVPWTELNLPLWRIEIRPALLRSILGSTAFIALLLLLTPFDSLGPGLSWNVAPWGILNWLARSIAWLGWAMGDELIFRKFILKQLKEGFEKSSGPRLLRVFAEEFSLLLTTALWIALRSWHQPLGWSHSLTLALAGLFFGLQVLQGRHYLVGAAWMGGSAWVFQSLFSLPLLGHDHTGLWIIRFNSPESSMIPGLRLIHGGAGGPGASLFIQILLMGLVTKILWTRRYGSIR